MLMLNYDNTVIFHYGSLTERSLLSFALNSASTDWNRWHYISIIIQLFVLV